jgi:hypothetical protein
LIPGLGTSPIGKSYEYADLPATNGVIYFYKLEDVEFKGASKMHGPVVAKPGLDSDGDGMTDDWELYYGLNPYDPSDAALDPDGDGKTNLDEFLTGSDPATDENSNVEESQEGPVRIIKSNEKYIIMELTTRTFEIGEKTADGETYMTISTPDYIHGYTEETGSPQLPAKGVLISIPQGASVSLNVLKDRRDTYKGYDNVIPVPEVTSLIGEGNEEIDIAQYAEREVKLKEEYIRDEEAYSQDSRYPAILAEVSPPEELRNQRLARVTFYPIQYNPSRGALTLNKKIRVKVVFHQEGQNNDKPDEDTSLPGTGNPFIKIALTEQGMYRINSNDLYNAGIADVAELDPRTFKLYHRGREIPILVTGEEDGWLDPEDDVIFYGESLKSKYTKSNVYWLTYGEESGLRMEVSDGNPGKAEESMIDFPGYYRNEQNEFYWPTLTGSDETDRWLSAKFVWNGTQQNFPLDLTGVSDNSELSARVRLSVWGLFDTEHHALIYFNNYLVATSLWGGTGEQVITADVSQAYLQEGNNSLTIESMLAPGSAYDLIVADWIEVDFWKMLSAEDNRAKFTDYGEGMYLFEIPGFSEKPDVFDITDPGDMKYIGSFQYEEGTVLFQDELAGWKDYLVVTEDRMKTPSVLEIDEPSNLRGTDNQADYLMITAEDFVEEVKALAEFRTGKGLTSKVIKVQDIYDEFNGGIQSPHAIKDFLYYTYKHWQKPAPTYVLLVGDASYDFKDNMGLGRSNYVPTYFLVTPHLGETGSDNWYVLLDGEEDRLADMLIGRIPARTAEEVRTVIDKTIAYEQMSLEETAGSWQDRVVLVADEDEVDFEERTEEIAGLLPQRYDARKLYLRDYGDPQDLTTDLVDEINDGALIVNYVGHGGIELWANKDILNNGDIQALQNENRLPLVVSATCLNSYYLHPFPYEAMAESFLMNASGGAVAAWSSTGMGDSGGQAALDRGLLQALFEEENIILGSAVHQSKVSLYQQSGDRYRDLLQTYTLFGDPALKLKIPVPENPPAAEQQIEEQVTPAATEVFTKIFESRVENAVLPENSKLITGTVTRLSTESEQNNDELFTPWEDSSKERGADGFRDSDETFQQQIDSSKSWQENYDIPGEEDISEKSSSPEISGESDDDYGGDTYDVSDPGGDNFCKDTDAIRPSVISDLAIREVMNSYISLTWTAPGDDCSTGIASIYDIRYRTDEFVTYDNWDTATQVTGEPGPGHEGIRESLTVTGLKPGTNYYFAVKTADETLHWSGLSNSAMGTTFKGRPSAPAAINDLSISTMSDTVVTLTWTAPGDDGNSGIANNYDIRYATDAINEATFESAVLVRGEPSPQPAGTKEYFTVTGLSPDTTYYFAVKTSDEVSFVSGLSNIAGAATAKTRDKGHPYESASHENDRHPDIDDREKSDTIAGRIMAIINKACFFCRGHL